MRYLVLILVVSCTAPVDASRADDLNDAMPCPVAEHACYAGYYYCAADGTACIAPATSCVPWDGGHVTE